MTRRRPGRPARESSASQIQGDAASCAPELSVKEFMGEDFEVAHVPPQAHAVLSDFAEGSAHYEVLDRRDQPL
jgi:hypothetical protein